MPVWNGHARRQAINAVKRTIFEMFLLAVAGAVIGFGYNATRAKGSIKPLKNYFARGTGTQAPSDREARADAGGLDLREGRPSDGVEHSDVEQSHGQLGEHPYKEIRLAEVVDVLNSPDTEMGLNVFVDARSEELYAAGHIPGAIRCDPYEVDACIDDVMQLAAAAEKVVVYCGGGECEDSIFMCRELLAAGIDHAAIYLFAGGWSEWNSNDLPVEVP
ncbi:MAG: rhodanese-like domain-containing protein [Phycisphaerae bacterium]